MASNRGLARGAIRLLPLASFAGLAAVGLDQDLAWLALISGAGATAAGGWAWKRWRQGDSRKQLRRRARANAGELARMARDDRIAAPQLKRIAALQQGLLESWEMLPAEYGPLLEEDIYAIVEEIEDTARLARRREALRRYLESVDRRQVSDRIRGLEQDLEEIEPGSPLRVPFESALSGRRDELAGYPDILSSISAINAQLESAESLLGSIHGELLALDTRPAPRSAGTDLVRLKEQVASYRRSLDEVTRSVEPLPETERVTAG